MGLWDDDGEDYTKEEAGNPYLEDPSKGVGLIAKLLPKRSDYTEDDRVVQQLDSLMDRRIMVTVRELGIGTLELSQRLAKLSDQITEYKKVRLLSGKSIVGLGGQFSSGKSCFINSCLGVGSGEQEIVLPEDQNPITSIPTYIVGGGEEKIYAYCGANMVPLDKDAMKAMTHEFFKKYGIGFSRFVSSIVIHTPLMPSTLANKLVFLDTPGYNKADVDTQDSLKDEHIAKEQIKAVDFLIWLVDISNGTLHERDAEFLQKVPADTPILVIVNKADKKSEQERSAVVESIKSTLEDRGIKVFGVTAYNSREGVEFSEENLVEKFLDFAARKSSAKNNLRKELDGVIASIGTAFKGTIKLEQERQYAMGHAIYKAQDILAICSLAYFYSRTSRRKSRLIHDEQEFGKIAGQIRTAMDRIFKQS